jgi:hypothetical protein
MHGTTNLWWIDVNVQDAGREVVDWTKLAKDSEEWLAVVSRVINIQVPYNLCNFWLAEELLPAQADLCTVRVFRQLAFEEHNKAPTCCTLT